MGLANFMVKKLKERGFTMNLLDPEVLDLPLLKRPFHFYSDPNEAPKVLHDVNKLIKEADAYVLVSAEYNNCIPAALTNMMDYFPSSTYKFVPSGIVTYSMGCYGGRLAGAQLRIYLGELGSPNCSYLFTIPYVHDFLDKDGCPTPSGTQLDVGAKKLIDELEWYATALKSHKEKVGKS